MLRYLALGDSYTIGEGIAEAARWPNVLADELVKRGIAIAPPRIIATTGWTCAELSAAMDQAEPLGSWDLVSLLIGVNDQYRGHGIDVFADGFTRLLDRAIALAGGHPDRVFVLAIPDWSVTPFAQASGRDLAAIANELDGFNAFAQSTCKACNVAYIDTAPVSRERGGESAMLAEDGLHPSARLVTLWAEQALPEVLSLLQRNA
jgi:lysophospholipase L1-like esterase